MPLHLVKLCVGCDSVSDLEDWISQKLKEKKRRGQKPEHVHTTRMVPKRASELTNGGSLYWVIRGRITCRERIVDIRPFTDKDGIGRCRVVLDGRIVLVEPRPRAAFQGWRYLEVKLPGCRKQCAANCRNWGSSRRQYCRSVESCPAWRRPAIAWGHL
jgi:hypothetical protein